MRGALLAILLLVAGCGSGGSRTASSTPEPVECAPFARKVSGIELYGEAYTWWDQAAGAYVRGSDPVEGGVLVFRPSGKLPSGHVSVVVRQVSDREIRVIQANWVHHRITRDEPVLDVSTQNDWSRVRVWWAPIGAMGSTVYAAYGFIAPQRPATAGERVAQAHPP